MIQLAQSNKGEKISVAFVTNHNIGFVGGGEKALMNYIRNAPPDEFDITLFQTDYLNGSTAFEEGATNINKIARTITVRNYENKLNIFSRNKFTLLFTLLLIYPVMLFLLRFVFYRKELKKMKAIDIKYVMQNEMSSLFPFNSGVVVGSNHSSMSRESPLVTKIVSRLMGIRLWYPKINAIHLFPASSSLVEVLRKDKSLVLPNGVNSELFYPIENNSSDMIKFLYVARLEPYKGILKLMDAWDMIEDQSRMELHIVGDGMLAENVRRRSGKQIIYHGPLKEEDLQATYRDCDIFVYPTAMDTFGLVVLEALSSGLYVIASRILGGSYDDFMAMGALEYCENDPEEIAGRMKEAALRIKEIRSRKNSIHEYVSANYDWKSITSKLYDFFEEVSR